MRKIRLFMLLAALAIAAPLWAGIDLEQVPCGMDPESIRATDEAMRHYGAIIQYMDKQASKAELQRYWGRCEKPFADMIRLPGNDGKSYTHTAVVAQKLGSPLFQEFLAGMRESLAKKFLAKHPEAIALIQRYLRLPPADARALFIHCNRLADDRDPMGATRDPACHRLGVLWVYAGLTEHPAADGIDRVRPIVSGEFYTVMKRRPQALDFILQRAVRDGGTNGRQTAMAVIACAKDFPDGATEATPPCRKVMADYLRLVRLTPQETVRALLNIAQSQAYWQMPPDARAQTPIDAVVDRSGVVQAYFGVKAFPWDR